jgi:type IV secretory pathway VirD2 relaxase
MTRDDDLPIFQPHFGKDRRVTARSGNGSLRNAVLAAARGSLRRAAARRTARARIAVRPPRPRDRRVIVKAHVQRLTAGGAKAAALHLRYIERDGVEKDRSKGVLYGAERPVRMEAFEQPRLGEKHQFRLIVSPEDAAELDLTDYVRRLMGNVERDLGRKLEWAAVNHYDTEHPHAHVVVRGVDRAGHELRFDRAYMSKGLRWRAQQLAAEELGPRREVDLRRALVREIGQERFTSLDRELERRAVGGRVEVRSGRARPGVDESHLVARLEHLEGLRLAERVSPGAWAFAEGWQKQLRHLGSRGDVLKQIHAAISGDPARYHVLRRGAELEADAPGARRVVSGRVASKGVADELKGGLYAVVETPFGGACQVDRRRSRDRSSAAASCARSGCALRST